VAWGTADTYCFGCTDEHPTGLRLAPRIEGHTATAAFAPTHLHEGPPGITHGGLTMAAIDEVMTILSCRALGGVWFTGTLTCRLAAPLPAGGRAHTITARIDRAEGRKAFLSATVTSADGAIAAEADGVWIQAAD
jgi:acyl-coenzyme A thioesterase PaaI-like protein